MDIPNYKSCCRDKYARNRLSKKKERAQLKQKSLTDIDKVVAQIKKLRIDCGNTNPPKLNALVKELAHLKKRSKRRIVAHSNQGLPAILEKLRYFIEILKTTRELIGEDVLKFLVDLFTTLYNIYKNNTWMSISINLTSFFSRHFPGDYATYVFDKFVAVFQVITTQSDIAPTQSFFQQLFTSVENVLDDELWTRLTEFFINVATLYSSLVKLVSFETIDINVVVRQFKLFKQTLPATTDIIESAFQACEFVFGHWDKICSGDWTVFLIGKDDAKSFETEVRLLENAFKFAYSNHVVELQDRFGMTQHDFEKRMEKAITRGESMARSCTSDMQKMAIANFLKILYTKRTDWYGRLVAAPARPEPFGVKMAGPSSCGKSTMCNIISMIIMHAYEFDPKQRGSVVVTNIVEKYESSIKPSHKVIICDDVYNNSNEKPNYDRILNYVNTIPRPLDKAGVDDKGNCYPGNCGLIVTTNVETLGVRKHSNCAESILRRFGLHIHVAIRAGFRNSFGGLIAQEETRFDVYELELCTFDRLLSDEDDFIDTPYQRTTEDGIVWNIVPRDVWAPDESDDRDFAQMCTYLAKIVKEHRIKQIAQMDLKAKLDSSLFCPVCAVPEILCSCNRTPSPSECLSCISNISEIPSDSDSSSNRGRSDESSSGITMETSEFIESKSIQSFVTENSRWLDTKTCRNCRHPIILCSCETAQWLDIQNCRRCRSPLPLCVCKPSTAPDPPEAIEAHFGDWLTAYSTRQLWQIRGLLHGSIEDAGALYKKTILWQILLAQRRYVVGLVGFVSMIPFIHLVFGNNVAISCLSLVLLSLCQIYYVTRRRVEETLQSRRDYLSSVCTTVQEHLEQNVHKYFAFGASFYLVYRMYSAMKPFFAEDTSTYLDKALPIFSRIVDKPNNRFTIRTEDERDYKEGYSRLPPSMTQRSATTTADDLRTMIHHSLRVVVIKSKGESLGTVNGLMVEGNVIMVPSHVIPGTDSFDVETTASPNIPSAKTKDQKITKSMVYIAEDKDFALIHLPSAPPSRGFLDFFPETQPTFRNRATVLIHKSHSNEVFESRQPIRPYFNSRGKRELSYVGMREKPGFLYGVSNCIHTYSIVDPYVGELEFNSFGGLCGSLYVDSSKALIYGFHVAGYVRGARTGWLTSVTKPMVEKGLEQLKTSSHAMVINNAADLNIDTYGTGYTLVNEKPLFLREDGVGHETIVTYLGQVRKDGLELTSNARTPYIPTVFKGVQEVLGACTNIPPKHPNDIRKSMVTLNKLHDPIQHYEHDALARAAEDYAEQTLSAIRNNLSEARDILRMYTLEEALDGIPNTDFCGIPNSTSAGFGIDRSKKHCFKRDPLDESLVKVPREFNDNYDIQKEIDRIEGCWLRGERSEPIFKASSKVNELLPKKKAIEKVRKFYGCPLAYFIASRKALGGIPLFMRRFWRETECCVGVNPMSGDWEELHNYLTEFNDDQMFAGDFSSYDTRMAAQVTTCVTKIMLSWYAEVGCSKQELALVKGALSDFVTPNVLFDGDLYRFASMIVSGTPLTAQCNSAGNSIIVRYGYYTIKPENTIPFKKNARLATYGDDNNLNVRKGCNWFNHTALQKVLADTGIQYTMANKTDESVPYITMDEMSFLKRKFKHHKELGCIVAPIEEESILKKFHFLKKPTESPLSKEEQWGAYSDSAFREALLHGRDYYEDFSAKMSQLVTLNPSLKSQVSIIEYEEMVDSVREEYGPDYKSLPRKLFTESLGTDLEEEDLFPELK